MAKIEKVVKPKVEGGRKVELKTEGVSGRLPAKSAFRPIECRLLENKLVISKGFDELLQRSFGKYDERKLELSFVEAIYLLEKDRISVKKGNKKLGYQELMDFGMERDRRLHEKYIVYKDIRERGFVAKTGFKFGCDFRVYQRGVGVKKGPKAASEHTKWIVYTVPEDYACSFAELSRAVRLAHSIRAQMLWAIVDNENDVTYFEVVRIKP